MSSVWWIIEYVHVHGWRYTEERLHWEGTIMDVRCFICGELMSDDEQKRAEVFKLKDVTEDFIRDHFGRVYDGFIFQHYGCWIESGRFKHYAMDFEYFFREMEARMYRSKKT
jgi:DNA-directed RNA polymerase subunit N (RpoN/RPB10)